MKIQPFLVGSGNAGLAIAKCLAMIPLIDPSVEIAPVKKLARGEPLPKPYSGDTESLLLLANPHGLHAQYLCDGDAAGFKTIVTEKPACVTLEDIDRLQRLKATVHVCHGYRQMWGPQTLKQMITAGELGEIVAMEGRYWQSSAAQHALTATKKPSWKDDIMLSGSFDTFVDLGAHWADLAFFLMGDTASESSGWLAYPNAAAAHRDTHAHLTLVFADGRRALASLSKSFHGMGNHLELNVLGTRQSARWSFISPDELHIARGGETRTLQRHDTKLGSRQPPFHGLGWLEGYMEILHQTVLGMSGRATAQVPTLSEHLLAMRALLTAKLVRHGQPN